MIATETTARVDLILSCMCCDNNIYSVCAAVYAYRYGCETVVSYSILIYCTDILEDAGASEMCAAGKIEFKKW